MKHFINKILHPLDPKGTDGKGWLEIARRGVHIEMAPIDDESRWYHAVTWIAFESDRKRTYRRRYVFNSELTTDDFGLQEFYKSSTEWKNRKG